METNQATPQQRRKRKMLVVMPLLILPFTTLIFWTLGGGAAESATATQAKGLSMKLPGAIFSDKDLGDKLSFYEKARADSEKKEQLRKADPFFKRAADSNATQPGVFPGGVFSPQQPPFGTPDGPGGNNGPALNAARISQRLTQLQAVLNKQPDVPLNPPLKREASVLPDSLLHPREEEDPELKQMNGLLEKILDIQHPERVKQPAVPATEKTAVRKFRAIPAVIEGNQKIVQGTVICMKLLDTVTIGGQLFPRGQKIYGSGTLASQRYTLNVKSIHVGADFYPVDLTVFDKTDGMEGINVPEAITNEAIRDGTVSGVQGMDLMSFDPSVGAQLTTAGINTVKDAFGKKVKRVKGKIRDGHLLLLRDNNENKNGH
ncbi:conjugative transposon protein TraM [Mucilaginibacter angelicae]|uniref:Conjugative transposon protein TraM n=1 Tax=Mucilaginibacter angelicae TaxID=869718 RepID=A0ABV6L5F2_9SPHI